MLDGSTNTPRFTDCPRCDGALEHGYLLGKHNRVRWSRSDKGMTIFHGVPLIRLHKGFWKTARWWLYAPNIPAVKCHRCRLVTFAYDNDEAERPARESWAAALIGLIMITAAAALVGFALTLVDRMPQVPLFALGALAITAALLAALGLIPLIHSCRVSRQANRLDH